MSTFAPIALPHIAPPDPSKHVNYQLGMVLGVDDFDQEFNYLAERDRRIVRDLIGYGVISGLHVTVADATDDRGPRLQVGSGGLVTPSGQLVCISPTQCAYVDEWLRANQQAIPLPPKELKLEVVACYRECETDDVPIPGEPCRSEDELMKPSRIQDSFGLELRVAAPPQPEEDAVRKFVAWARKIDIVDVGHTSLPKFVLKLETLAGLAAVPPSPEPLAFLEQPPPSSLRIPRARCAEYLEALFAFWVTHLRARARSGSNTAECGCCGGAGALDRGADCLRIASIAMVLETDGTTGEIRRVTASPIRVDESGRPDLLHLRMLQEWMLTAPAPPPPAEPPPVVVSGLVSADATVRAAVGGLKVIRLADGIYLLTYPDLDPTVLQLVTCQLVGWIGDKQPVQPPLHLERLDPDDIGVAMLLANQPDGPPPPGVVVRVRDEAGEPVDAGFTVRIEATKGVL